MKPATSCAPDSRAVRVSTHRSRSLVTEWELTSVASGAADSPESLEALAPTWIEAEVPGTAARAMQRAGLWGLDEARDFDDEDWWYRARFAHDPSERASVILALDGLATLADVWVGETHVLRSESMFLGHERDISELLEAENQLLIRFAALPPALKARRGRPRWRTPMLRQQKLRWLRTTLLGRTPGWSPPAAPVGPFRAVRLDSRPTLRVRSSRLSPQVIGGAGRLEMSATFALQPGVALRGARLRAEREGVQHVVDLEVSSDGVAGILEIPDVEQWWPHTHGSPARYRTSVELDLATPEAAGASSREVIELSLGETGFRSVQVATDDGGFCLQVNGHRVFCRGAVWTPADALGLTESPARTRRLLEMLRDAGMNMLRVPGTSVYEERGFLAACDELGILVWHDFMFANMDYPDDAGFHALVAEEVRQAADRWQGHPCVAVVCGNSECEQQAAMWGAEREAWRQPLFESVIAQHVAEALSGVVYWPSSARGGAFPHQPGQGTCSYFGVGAYLRGMEDLRASNVRFASECLAFANIPDPRTLEAWGEGSTPTVVEPRWKARCPRDLGTGWDFDDVRDHYVESMFGIDSSRLRYSDHDRYLELGRAVTCELVEQSIRRFRSPSSSCDGALVLFARDLWLGPGWGLIDALDRAKSPLHGFRRAASPVALALFDEGLNGIFVELHNDRATAVSGELSVTSYDRVGTKLEEASVELEVAARSCRRIASSELLGRFADLGFCYRFGPQRHDVVVATFQFLDGSSVSPAFLCPDSTRLAQTTEIGLELSARAIAPGTFELEISSPRFAYAVALDAGEFVPDDNYFSIAPKSRRTIVLRGPIDTPMRCLVKPLNAVAASRIVKKP